MNEGMIRVLEEHGRWQRIGIIVSASWRNMDIIGQHIEHLYGATVIACADFPRRNKVKNIVLARKRSQEDMKFEEFDGNPFDVIRHTDAWLFFWDMDGNAFEQELADLIAVLGVDKKPGQYITIDGKSSTVTEEKEGAAHWDIGNG